jgi:carboxymethylenebutenolidase
LSQCITLQLPLSRCGKGPGVILIRPLSHAQCQEDNKTLDPEPLKKWAEESFIVAQITLDSSNSDTPLQELINDAENALLERTECDSKKIGLIGGMDVNHSTRIHTDSTPVNGPKGEYDSNAEQTLQSVLACDTKLAAAVVFDSWDISFQSTLFHLPKDKTSSEDQIAHVYSDVSSANFMIPGHPDFKMSKAGVAHTRSVAFIKKHLGGPFFDLEKIWDEHTYFEFEDRSVEKTMATMVQEPYVNHVPTVCQ